MAFGAWFMNKPNSTTYIKCSLWKPCKKYGTKNSIANAINVIATYM
jgi:hypothetical protein